MFEVLSVIKTALGWIGWLGIGIVPLAIAAAVIWFDPKLLKPALTVAAVWIALFAVYTIGDGNGAARVQAQWDEAKIAYAESMENLRQSAQAEAAAQSDKAAQAERERADAAEGRISDYEQKLAAAPIGACALDDADLAAAGLRAPGGGRGDGKSIRRHSR